VKKRAPKEPGSAVPHIPSPEWVEVKEAVTKDALVGSLEVRIGSCVINISHGFDKPLFVEACKALLSLS